MTSATRHIASLLALLLVPAIASAQAAATDTSGPKPRRSWTSDRREFVAGDILTVLVDEQTIASANKGQSGSDVTSGSKDINAQAPVGPLVAGVNVTMGSGKKASSSQSGAATRDVRFRGEMTVRVVKVAANGVLEVKGVRTVDVDKNKQELTLSGFVRPEDVSHTNTIDSARIADAQLLYTLTGELGGTHGSIISKIIGMFWP